MIFLIYILLIIFIIADAFLAFKFFEYVYCAHIRKQAPLVPSNQVLRQYVIDQILTKYPKSKNICEIGSGFGGLARDIARKCNKSVYALENMPFSAFISKTADIFTHCKNNRTIWCDAFKFLDNTNINFDIAIAYLGPKLTPKLYKYKDKIKVLISLDFEIPDIKPKRIIDLDCGSVIYGGKKYPHKILIYEF